MYFKTTNFSSHLTNGRTSLNKNLADLSPFSSHEAKVNQAGEKHFQQHDKAARDSAPNTNKKTFGEMKSVTLPLTASPVGRR